MDCSGPYQAHLLPDGWTAVQNKSEMMQEVNNTVRKWLVRFYEMQILFLIKVIYCTSSAKFQQILFNINMTVRWLHMNYEGSFLIFQVLSQVN